MNLVINKIRNKDCFEGMSEMKDSSVNHVFTSPPYNRKRNDKYSNYDDTIVDYKGFLNKCLDECLRVSKDFVFFNIQKNYYNKKEVFQIIGEYSNEIIDIIIWNKTNPMPGPGSTVANAYEFIIVLSKTHRSLKANKTYTKNSFQTSVYSNNKYTKIHKASMHPGACEYIVENFMKEGDLVLDPFMGLGTTAITCLKNKIDYVGFELSEEYCKLAEERIKECVDENHLLLF